MAASDLDREISSRTILEMSLHELNNDVSRLPAVVSALRTSPTFALMTAADREAITALEEAAHRLQTRQQMVSELVVWMRLPDGSEPKLAALDLDRAVEGWITAEARHRDRIMHTRSSVPVVVRGSEAAIATILDNVVGNAAQVRRPARPAPGGRHRRHDLAPLRRTTVPGSGRARSHTPSSSAIAVPARRPACPARAPDSQDARCWPSG